MATTNVLSGVGEMFVHCLANEVMHRERNFIAGKTAIVTGAGSGIGAEVAKMLYSFGAGAIALVDLKQEGLKQTAGMLEESLRFDGKPAQCRLECFVGDTANAAFRKTVFDAMSGDDVPRICIPAAGITRDLRSVTVDKATGKAVLYPEAAFDLVLNVNLKAPIYWALETVGRIAERRVAACKKKWDITQEPEEGVVVFLGSVCRRGQPTQIAYAASKAGLVGAAGTAEFDWGFHGVRCHDFHPGFNDTPVVRVLAREVIEKATSQMWTKELIQPWVTAFFLCLLVCFPELERSFQVGGRWPMRQQ